MHILFSTYALAFQNPGGGEQVFNAMRSHLIQKGHAVTVFNPWNRELFPLSQFDVIHYFSCIDPFFWNFVKTQSSKTPLVVTPTYRQEKSIRNRARLLGKRLRQSVFPSGPLYDLPDLWLPNTEIEARDLETYQGVTHRKIHVLPNGVENHFLQASPEPFLATLSMKPPFILNVGRFHPVKNQLTLIEAVRRAGLKCVFIGSPDMEHQSYYQSCVQAARQAEASDPGRKVQFLFVDPIPHHSPLLPSAYASAAAFVLPSHFETFGLSALEAAIASPRLILTQNMASHDIFKDIARFVDPFNPEEIRHTILEVLREPAHPKKSQVLFDKYNWNKICDLLVDHYSDLRRTLPK